MRCEILDGLSNAWAAALPQSDDCLNRQSKRTAFSQSSVGAARVVSAAFGLGNLIGVEIQDVS